MPHSVVLVYLYLPYAVCSSIHMHCRESACFLDDARLWYVLLRSWHRCLPQVTGTDSETNAKPITSTAATGSTTVLPYDHHVTKR